MSVLRLLTPSFGHSSHHPAPTLTLHVPAYGVLYLTRPRPESSSSQYDPESEDQRSTSNTLRGELEINVPKGLRKRCRSIKVGIQTIVKLAMGIERGWEEDCIFERESVHQGASSEGIWLEEGITKYEFTFELPQTLATHDWHPEGKIRHELYAEIEGIPTSHFSFFHRGRTQSPAGSSSRSRQASKSRHQTPSASRHHSPISSRAPSPAPGEHSFLSNLNLREPPSISLVQQVGSLPPVPTYEQSEAIAHAINKKSGGAVSASGGDEHDGTWLEGTFRVVRAVKLVYNPHPTGGINALEERTQGDAPGLGRYELMFRAPVWTVGSILSCSFTLTNLPPTCTIFDLRVNLIQNIHTRSPRDQTELDTHRPFTIIKSGKRPNPDLRRPGKDYKALWRGSSAHGTDEGSYEFNGKGRMPRDRDARPSTCEGLVTPLKITHHLALECVFAIWGQDAWGNEIGDKPGDQRRLKIARPVVLPACPILPQVFSLPAYPTHPRDKYASPNTPCALCHTPIEDKVCTTCPFDTPSHVRHDLPSKLVGNKEGVCPLCAESLFPAGEVGRRNCACALTDEEFEVLAKGDREAQAVLASGSGSRSGGDAGGGGGGGWEDKEEWEGRGRERTRRGV